MTLLSWPARASPPRPSTRLRLLPAPLPLRTRSRAPPPRALRALHSLPHSRARRRRWLRAPLPRLLHTALVHRGSGVPRRRGRADRGLRALGKERVLDKGGGYRRRMFCCSRRLWCSVHPPFHFFVLRGVNGCKAFIVTVVFWALLSSPDTFSTTFSAWFNSSLHALNSAFAVLALLFSNAPPAPLLALPVQILLLAGHLGVAYITKAGQGFYRAWTPLFFLRFSRFSSPSRERLCGAGRRMWRSAATARHAGTAIDTCGA
ncbi:hypothetical protein FB451DRAFT_443573 [Mycena latifolia]|nr:hypothetical protein FB451DRAFT_443573 [Mycena latifolia]